MLCAPHFPDWITLVLRLWLLLQIFSVALCNNDTVRQIWYNEKENIYRFKFIILIQSEAFGYVTWVEYATYFYIYTSTGPRVSFATTVTYNINSPSFLRTKSIVKNGRTCKKSVGVWALPVIIRISYTSTLVTIRWKVYYYIVHIQHGSQTSNQPTTTHFFMPTDAAKFFF